MKDFKLELLKLKTKGEFTGQQIATIVNGSIDSIRQWLQGKATPSEERQKEVLEAIKKALG